MIQGLLELLTGFDKLKELIMNDIWVKFFLSIF